MHTRYGGCGIKHKRTGLRVCRFNRNRPLFSALSNSITSALRSTGCNSTCKKPETPSLSLGFFFVLFLLAVCGRSRRSWVASGGLVTTLSRLGLQWYRHSSSSWRRASNTVATSRRGRPTSAVLFRSSTKNTGLGTMRQRARTGWCRGQRPLKSTAFWSSTIRWVGGCLGAPGAGEGFAHIMRNRGRRGSVLSCVGRAKGLC